MKFIRVLLAFSLILCASSAHAQVPAKEALSTPIRYSPAVPKSVLKLMPRGAKSLFWGTFSPSKGSALMAVHLFVPNPKKDFAYIDSGEITHHFALDVFRQDKKVLRRVKRVPVSYVGSIHRPEWTKATFFWINQKNNTVPLLVFDCLTSGQHGEAGDAIFVSFAHGWSGQAQVQASGLGNFSDGGYSYTLQTGAKEILYVQTSFSDISTLGEDNIDHPLQLKFNWNGLRFAATSPTPTQSPTMSDQQFARWKP